MPPQPQPWLPPDDLLGFGGVPLFDPSGPAPPPDPSAVSLEPDEHDTGWGLCLGRTPAGDRVVFAAGEAVPPGRVRRWLLKLLVGLEWVRTTPRRRPRST
ncbi:MAG: hypothetical protein K2X82_08275 [Gemmataceae bacterium]|nr:hypothetical protein [Gemmataceae bacterium]